MVQDVPVPMIEDKITLVKVISIVTIVTITIIMLVIIVIINISNINNSNSNNSNSNNSKDNNIVTSMNHIGPLYLAAVPHSLAKIPLTFFIFFHAVVVWLQHEP